jgi:hypothetical protein
MYHLGRVSRHYLRSVSASTERYKVYRGNFERFIMKNLVD